MMARPGRQLAEAHRAQLPAQGLLGDRDGELVPDPLPQIDQPPANNPVNRWDRPALDNLGKPRALCLVEPRPLTRRLAIDKTVRPRRVELPVWAALSASGMGSIVLPEVVREVIILADADEP